MSTELIDLEFEETDDPLDDGVDREYVATENFDFHGEQVERETKIALLEDGGVHLTQRLLDQDTLDTMTLGSEVVDKIIAERDADE